MGLQVVAFVVHGDRCPYQNYQNDGRDKNALHDFGRCIFAQVSVVPRRNVQILLHLLQRELLQRPHDQYARPRRRQLRPLQRQSEPTDNGRYQGSFHPQLQVYGEIRRETGSHYRQRGQKYLARVPQETETLTRAHSPLDQGHESRLKKWHNHHMVAGQVPRR